MLRSCKYQQAQAVQIAIMLEISKFFYVKQANKWTVKNAIKRQHALVSIAMFAKELFKWNITLVLTNWHLNPLLQHCLCRDKEQRCNHMGNTVFSDSKPSLHFVNIFTIKMNLNEMFYLILKNIYHLSYVGTNKSLCWQPE